MDKEIKKGYAKISDYFSDILKLTRLKLELFSQTVEDARNHDTIKQIKALELEMKYRNRLTLERNEYIPLEYISSVFELTDFERHCLITAIAAEIDGSLKDEYRELLNQPQGAPSLEFAIKLYADSFDEYIGLLSEFTVRKNYLSMILDGAGQSNGINQPFRLKRRIVDFILSSSAEEEEHLGKLFLPSYKLQECIGDRELFYSLQRYIESVDEKAVIILTGEKGSGRKYHIKRFGASFGVPLLFVEGGRIVSSDEEGIKDICVEAIIQQAMICITDIPFEQDNIGEKVKNTVNRITEYNKLLFITAEEGWEEYLGFDYIRHVKYKISANNAAQRIQAWKNATENRSFITDVDFALIANKYSFTFGMIRQAAERALETARLAEKKQIDEDIINTACKEQISHSLGKRAVSVKAQYTWDELVLPPPQKTTLRNACDQLKYRDVVYEQWNFKKKMAYGKGLSMLFSGPPGTGKTMAAQVIANDVKMDIYKVDLSSLVSKYIGETEKNLSLVFDEVKRGNSILFFDEADSIFGKRGEQKDSNDRFANLQTSYLLQRFEDYEGIVILATNFVQNFDDAFLRRIKFKVDFPFPDSEYRQKIWQSLMIPEAPFEGIDIEFLSQQFTLSGSSIKNVVINAAFLAAAESTAITMKHIISAVKVEYGKINKIMLKDELKEYADLY